MKTYAKIVFVDKSSVTQWFPMSREEAEDKLRPGRYLMRYGKPKMIAELDLICWDIGRDSAEVRRMKEARR